MSTRSRTAALGATLALGVWFFAADSSSAQEKEAKVGPYNADILKLAGGKGSAEDIAKKAELGDVMQAFKPRSKGGLGVGRTPDAIKPDGIEQKLIALGKSKKGVGKSEMDALARAADATRAVAEITVLYADKEGKKNSVKWKQLAGDMKISAEAMSDSARKADAASLKKAVDKLNASCNDCHSDFRD
jgi:hypothetical protein